MLSSCVRVLVKYMHMLKTTNPQFGEIHVEYTTTAVSILAHKCVLKFLFIISAIYCVGPTLIQIPVVVYIGNSQALCINGICMYICKQVNGLWSQTMTTLEHT